MRNLFIIVHYIHKKHNNMYICYYNKPVIYVVDDIHKVAIICFESYTCLI